MQSSRYWVSKKDVYIYFLQKKKRCILTYKIHLIFFSCGTGTWLLEMAKTYPNNLYCGIDTVPMFPLMNVPPNISFINADILDKLPFGSETFDFVHQQLLVRNFNNKDWEFVINEIVRVTKPLGHIELMEMDLVPYQQGPITNKLHEACKFIINC